MKVKRFLKVLCIVLTFTIISCDKTKEKESKSFYPITPVPFTNVTLTDDFWSGRIETNRTVTIPYGFEKCEKEGRVRNFERAGGLLEGKYEGKMPFDDSDIYKIIEGASYSLSVHPDPELEKYIDDIIDKIAAAQEDDGYLYTPRALDPEHIHEVLVTRAPDFQKGGGANDRLAKVLGKHPDVISRWRTQRHRYGRPHRLS
ncbi:MAG: glycoside hydrolase family 127 protein, partial [candidate division WOR-3 bacterium]